MNSTNFTAMIGIDAGLEEYGIEAQLKQSTFPAGERYLKITNVEEILEVLNEAAEDTDDEITVDILVTLLNASPEAIMDCMLFVDAVKRNIQAKMDDNFYFIYTLKADYLPYSRQDRVCSVGESFSLRVFLDMIYTQFNSIETIDIHNPKVLEDEDTTRVIALDVSYLQDDFINVFGEYNMPIEIPQEEAVLIAVDKGARERVQMAAEDLDNFNDIVQIIKERIPNGIKSTIDDESLEALKKANIGIIVDDICDGGATFLKSADIIRKVNPDIELILIVTHGIFSAGLESLQGQFDSLMVLETDYNFARLEKL